MPKRMKFILFSATILTVTVFAKQNPAGALPAALLRAHTVAVLIDPDAGIALTDPQANQTAQKDVEQSLQAWGRFTPVLSLQSADLIVTVRCGHGKLVQPTIADPRQNSRPGEVIPTDGGIGIGAQHGRPSSQGQRDASNFPQTSPAPRAEASNPDDVFAVYVHNAEDTNDPLDSPPAWRFVGKNALKPHGVPAVEEFKKAVAVADKVAASSP